MDMSFPPRNLMTGVHMGPGMIPGHYMGMGGGMVPPPVGFMPPMMPPMSAVTGRGPQTYRGAPDGTVAQRGPQPPTRRDNQGPPVTVFVGNITERAPDVMIRHILNACGPVLTWKRVQGASGRLQAFGFCEFGNPDAGLRAIRLLHDYQISDKKLVVKVDAKTQSVLDEFKDKMRKGRSESSSSEDNTDTDFLDEGMKAFDKSASRRIQQVIQEHSQEMNNYQNPLNKQARERKLNKQSEKLLAARENDSSILEKPADLEDVEMEGDKKELISREIGKFREIMKRQEEEREAERRQREERDRERRERERDHRENSQPSLATRSFTRSRSHSRSYSPQEGSYTNKIRARVERRRSRSRSVEPLRKSEADLLKEREEEQERKEKKKLERKAQEKEAAYQERLRAWETRERKKAREYDRERAKEREKRAEMEREARRLKEFLEDYDDERDDPKYYKGRELQRRMAEREREKDQDERDRQREREELAEIKARILQAGHPDPHGEYERIRQEREEMYQPRYFIRPEERQSSSRDAPMSIPPPEQTEDISQSSLPSVSEGPMPMWVQPPDASPNQRDSPIQEFAFKPVYIKAPVISQAEGSSADHGDSSNGPTPAGRPASPPPSDFITPSPALPPSDTDDGEHTMSPRFTPISQQSEPQPPPPPPPPREEPEPASQSRSSKSSKKKKLDIKDVFNTEDEEEVEQKRKRKLPSMPTEGEEKRSQEEKRKHIKSIIDRIPTDKQELFNYCLHWDAVDGSLMERRIRPWINKKIVEYIGEPEPTLVDFICQKVLAGSSPTSILQDVQMVLDEEAEVFVVKMWRLLIYEIEAKKMGLVK